MTFLRRVARYTRTDHERNTEIRKTLTDFILHA